MSAIYYNFLIEAELYEFAELIAFVQVENEVTSNARSHFVLLK